MKILWQIGILFAVCLLGEGISLIIPFPFPPSVIAMIILLLLMLTKRLKAEKLKETSDFFLSIMSFLFIPAGVGIINVYDSIKDHILPLLIICILTTIITFAVTSFAVRFFIWLQERLTKPKGGKQP